MTTSVNMYILRGGQSYGFTFQRTTSTLSWTVKCIATNTTAKNKIHISVCMYSKRFFGRHSQCKRNCSNERRRCAEKNRSMKKNGNIKSMSRVKQGWEREGIAVWNRFFSLLHPSSHVLNHSWGPLSEQSNIGLSSFLWNDPRSALQHMSALLK